MSYNQSALCPRKESARRTTIIEQYREHFRHSLPKEKQYWTLAGPCYDEEGKLGKKSELFQMMNEGLIKEEQYYGIDNSEEIVEKNRKVSSANFIHGDFSKQFLLASERPNFNPGIVYADFTRMAPSCVVAASNVIHCLTTQDISEVMVVVNILHKNPYGDSKKKTDPEVIWEMFVKNQRFNQAFQKGWEVLKKVYTYGGTGIRSRSEMVSFIFFHF